jgi:hypothetical protein
MRSGLYKAGVVIDIVEELKIAACVLPEDSTHRGLLLRAADALQSLRCAWCGHEYRPGVTVRERGQFVCPGPVEKPCGARYVWENNAWRAENPRRIYA